MSWNRDELPDLSGFPPLPENGEPLADRLAEALTEAIRIGVLRQGQKLPDQYRLGRHYACSHTTAYSALRLLVDRRVIHNERGHGYFARGGQ